jgi:hypothetical protein
MNDNREQWRIDMEREWKERRRKDKENKRTKQKQRRRKEHDKKTPLSKGEAIKEMYRVADTTGLTMSAYPCEFCDSWHIGEYKRKLNQETSKARGPRVRKEISGNEISNNLGDLFGDLLESLDSDGKQC